MAATAPKQPPNAARAKHGIDVGRVSARAASRSFAGSFRLRGRSAAPGRPMSAAAAMKLIERLAQFLGHHVKCARRRRLRACYQHIVPIRAALCGHDRLAERAQTPFCAIARNRIANFFGGCESQPRPGFGWLRRRPRLCNIVRARRALQDETWICRRRAPREAQKIRAIGQSVRASSLALGRSRRRHRTKCAYAERRLRPNARRRAMIFRPFFVAIRARNPCRRARTKLLGWNVRFMAGLICRLRRAGVFRGYAVNNKPRS